MRELIRFTLLLSICSLMFSGCAKKVLIQEGTPENSQHVVNAEENAKSMDGPGSLVKLYASLEDLTADAEEIIEVTVADQQSIVYMDMPFTISSVKIMFSAKGKLAKNEVMDIIETGGKFIHKDKEGKVSKETEMKFNGISVLKRKEHAFLFVRKFVGPQVEDAYVPLGVYQGKFLIDSAGEVIQQAPENEKLKFEQPNTVEHFIKSIKMSLAK